MKLLSTKAARKVWSALFVLCVVETVGLFTIAPLWDGGVRIGELYALACFAAGVGVMSLLLSITEPGTAPSTRVSRYLFAFMGGLAFNVIVTWGLWALEVPIMNGTVRRGLMAENYWLGPAILAYAVWVWLVYRAGLAKETAAT